MVEARRRGDDYYQTHREGEEVKESLRWHNEHGNPRWKDVPEEQWPQKIDSYVVFFEGDGSVFVNSESPLMKDTWCSKGDSGKSSVSHTSDGKSCN